MGTEPPREFPETVLCESRGQRRVLALAIVRRFGLGRWAVPDRFEDPPVVEPGDPVECCELHRLKAWPRAAGSESLGLVQPDDGSASQLRRPGRCHTNRQRSPPIARCRPRPGVRCSGWTGIATRGHPGPSEAPGLRPGASGVYRPKRKKSRCSGRRTPSRIPRSHAGSSTPGCSMRRRSKRCAPAGRAARPSSACACLRAARRRELRIPPQGELPVPAGAPPLSPVRYCTKKLHEERAKTRRTDAYPEVRQLVVPDDVATVAGAGVGDRAGREVGLVQRHPASIVCQGGSFVGMIHRVEG